MRILDRLFLLAALAVAGCDLGELGDEGGEDAGPQAPEPPPPEPTPPAAASYVRGSLSPIFQLTPRAEYGRFTHDGVNMSDSDFTSAATLTSAAQKIDEIAFQIGRESGGATPDLIPHAEDRQRAQQIPFRGNPSDVELLELDGAVKAFVPLGGDLMTPGNEVAIVSPGGAAQVTRVKVGVRPQRLAAHPSGLVFVCNQYSNYISIIDARTSEILRVGSEPVEVKTEYYCTDLLLVERDPRARDVDEVDLYVSNSWRASVLKYGLSIQRDPLTGRPVDVRIVEPAAPDPAHQPAAEITGVGSNPRRLSLSESQDALYVANGRGGELARISISGGGVKRLALGAPSIDVVHIGDTLFVPTTMRDRGLLSRDEAAYPQQVLAQPAVVTGIDGQAHEAHPGALFDGTRSYNFEDVRNGVLSVDFQLSGSTPSTYFTDDVSSEPNYVAQQKVLAGALPQEVVRSAAGDRIYIALGGSDLVQELEVRAGAFELRPTGREFATSERPFALALDEERGQLYVATWGGEVLEIFDLQGGERLDLIDLGYAAPSYPATAMERGEYFYYNADWSNNGRKSCATCHLDELLADGIGFSNGATAPTAYHQVPANFNLMTTDSYFWNGSFSNGGYTSLALAAQTRTNCELILFGLIEGPSSDPDGRLGDPNNRVTDGQDEECRPILGVPGALPENFDQIAEVIAAQKAVAAELVEQETGFDREAVFRFVDFYSVSELRLPPNPLRRLYEAGALAPEASAQIDRGAELFKSAGCANCHDPDNARHPYTDGLNHGAGADWTQRFASTYLADPRIVDEIGGIPEVMLDAIASSAADSEINIHLAPIDYFTPFCFDDTSCLAFEDPLVVKGVEPAESERLDRLVRINLADPDRGFVPGNLPGQPQVNTPSLRGLWWRTNYLHHGLADSIGEAILGPGHPSLRDGERGFAINTLGELDVHGQTSQLSADDVKALILFVKSIE